LQIEPLAARSRLCQRSILAGSIPAMMRRGTAAIVRFRLFAENAQSSSGFETMVVTTAMLVN
jgi:hypothetical protein